MYAAINHQGHLVYAQEVGPKKVGEPYTCPDCGQVVLLKQSVRGRYYFAHQDLQSQREETASHRKSLNNLAAWIREEGMGVQVEPYLGAIDQYPDLLWEDGRRAGVLEVQCSRIPSHILLKRTQAIESQGLNCQWILGQAFASKRLNEMQALCIRYGKQWGHYLLYAQKRGIEVWSQVSITYPGWRLSYVPLFLDYHTNSFSYLSQDIQDFEPVRPHMLLKDRGLSLKKQMSLINSSSPQVQLLREAYYLQRQVLIPKAQEWIREPQGLLSLKDPAWLLEGYIRLLLVSLPRGQGYRMDHLKERLHDLCARGALRPRPLYHWQEVFDQEVASLVNRLKKL